MLRRFTPILLLVATCWVVFFVNVFLFQGQLNHFGIIPRQVYGLPGILCSPFLHASFQHLAANTLPLLVLGAILCSRRPGEFLAVTLAGIPLTGGLIWLLARNANHIGASSLVFCYFGYLTALAWFHRTFFTVVVAVLCFFAYGGMLVGIVPNAGPISWEGHLAGLLTGIFLARLAPRTKSA